MKEVNHTVRQIQNAEIVMDPYPHVQVMDVFPDNLYACMMQHLPEKTSTAGASTRPILIAT